MACCPEDLSPPSMQSTVGAVQGPRALQASLPPGLTSVSREAGT